MTKTSMLRSLLLAAGFFGSGCTDTGDPDQAPASTEPFEFMIQMTSGSAYVVRQTGSAQRICDSCEAIGVSPDRGVAAFYDDQGVVLLLRDGARVEFPPRFDLHWSPDGRSIAIGSPDDLLIANADGTTRHVVPVGTGSGLTNLGDLDMAAWSPDSRYFARSSTGVTTIDADTGQTFAVTPLPGTVSWSPDSQRLASLQDNEVHSEHGVIVVGPEGLEPVTESGFGLWSAIHGWSPDSRWLAASGLNSTTPDPNDLDPDDGQLKILDAAGSIVATAPPSLTVISRDARWAWRSPILAHYTETEQGLPAFGLWSPEGTRTMPFGDVCATASIITPRWSPDDSLLAYDCFLDSAATTIATVLVDPKVPSRRASFRTRVIWNGDWSRAATLDLNGNLTLMGPTGDNAQTLATGVQDYRWLRAPDSLTYRTQDAVYVARTDGSERRKVLDFPQDDPPWLDLPIIPLP